MAGFVCVDDKRDTVARWQILQIEQGGERREEGEWRYAEETQITTKELSNGVRVARQ